MTHHRQLAGRFKDIARRVASRAELEAAIKYVGSQRLTGRRRTRAIVQKMTAAAITRLTTPGAAVDCLRQARERQSLASWIHGGDDLSL